MKHITAGLAWLIVSMLAIIAMVIWFPGPASQARNHLANLQTRHQTVCGRLPDL